MPKVKNFKNELPKKYLDYTILGLTFLIPFTIYFLTLNPTLSVYADAAEFPLVAYLNGFAHPSGYPLFVMIVKLFQLLPLSNPAYEGNLAAAFLGAATLPIFYLLAYHLSKNKIASLAGAGMLAFAEIFWRNSLVAEVFTSVAFLTVLTTLIFVLWVKTREKKYFYILAFISGIDTFHHQIIVVTLAGIFVWFLIERGWRHLSIKDYLIGAALFSLGLLPYLYVFIVAQGSFPIEWENPDNLPNLLKLILRLSYGSTFTISSVGAKQSIDYFEQIKGVSLILSQNLKFIGIVLAGIGAITLFKTNKGFLACALLVLTGIMITSIAAGMFVLHYNEIPYLERFQIPSLIFLSLMASCGIAFLMNNLSKVLPKLSKEILFVLFGIIPLTFIILNFNQLNQRNNYFGEFLPEDILSGVEPEAIVLTESDGAINSLLYYKYVLGKRPHVAIIASGLFNPGTLWYLEEIRKFYPDLKIPQGSSSHNFLLDFLALNSDKPIYLEIHGIFNGRTVDFPIVRRGLLWQYNSGNISDDTLEEATLALEGYKNLEQIKKNGVRPGSGEYPYHYLYTDKYIFMGAASEGQKTREYFQRAIDITPTNSAAYLVMGNFFEYHNQPSLAVQYWEKALKFRAPPEMIKYAKEQIKKYQDQN